jgi:hypothetical protein
MAENTGVFFVKICNYYFRQKVIALLLLFNGVNINIYFEF